MIWSAAAVGDAHFAVRHIARRRNSGATAATSNSKIIFRIRVIWSATAAVERVGDAHFAVLHIARRRSYGVALARQTRCSTATQHRHAVPFADAGAAPVVLLRRR